MTLPEYPGFTAFASDMQTLLRRVEDGDASARPMLLQRAADALNVLIGLELLQYVFMPAPEDDDSEPIDIDLIAPPQTDLAAIAWFSVDEAGYDEFRDAVTLFGDLTEMLNPPIVLDVEEDPDSEVPGSEPAE